MSQKSERLVNLTIALLASRRFLTKSEIFSKIPGYDGDQEARDRMFERDKEELRQIGIEIEVGAIDAYFDDEVGYRINRKKYQLQLQNLSPIQLALISLAEDAFQSETSVDAVHGALIKLKSSGLEVDQSILPDILQPYKSIPTQLDALIEAISYRKELTFEYLNQELVSEIRHVAPWHLSHKKDRWYLTALDTDKQELRTFRLDRIVDQITVAKRGGTYEIDFEELQRHLHSEVSPKIAVIKVRKDRALRLRKKAKVVTTDIEWDVIEVPYWDERQMRIKILWEERDAVVLSPDSLRSSVIDSLANVLVLHG